MSKLSKHGRRRIGRIGALLFLLFSPLALAQSVRELGMGGVILPGPGASWENPAYGAVPARFERNTWSVPLGLLGLLFPDRSPLYYFVSPDTFYANFDLLSFYDQISHLDAFLLNPAQSPDEVKIKIRQDQDGNLQIRVEDGSGNPIQLDTEKNVVPPRPDGSVPKPLLTLPFQVGTGLSGQVGIFASVDRLSIRPDAKLAALLAGASLQANETYTLSTEGAASAGISIGFSLTRALPSFPKIPGTIYVGVRGEGFLGLGRFEGESKLSFTTDANGLPAGSTRTQRIFYSYLGQGYGYGARLDLGIAYANQTGVFGLGIRDLLSFSQWQGVEFVEDEGGSSERTMTKTYTGSGPAFYLSGAGYLPLGEAGKLLIAADIAYEGAPSGHLGTEYSFRNVAFRAGIGYENGPKFGLGLGIDLVDMQLDFALTSHTAPLTGGQVYGITAAVGF